MIPVSVLFRAFVKGDKHVNYRAKGGSEEYINTSNAFLSARNIILELIDFLKLVGYGDMLP